MADAGMIFVASQKAIEAAVVHPGMGIPDVPYVVARWHRQQPGERIPDGDIFIQPRPARATGKRRDQVID